MLKKYLSLLVIVILLAASGCKSHVPTSGGNLSQALVGNPELLNPLLTVDGASLKIYDYIFEGLLRYDENMQLVGQLAKKWEFSSDNLEWTFFLKENVSWHDGRPFSARDVEFTYATLALSEEYPGTRSDEFSLIKEIQVLDDFTIKFRLNASSGPFLNKLTQPIIPRHIYDPEVAVGADKVSIGNMAKHPRNWKPIGTGPFKFGTWVKDQYILLERNEDYPGDNPYLQTVRLKFYPNLDKAVSDLLAGNTDLVEGIPYDVMNRIESDLIEGYNFYPSSEMGCEFLAFNFRSDAFGKGRINPLTENRVRQAIALALDKEEMIQELLNGRGAPMDSSVPALSWAYRGGSGHSHDAYRAEELLEAAGWVRRLDTWRYKSGQRLEIQLTARKDIDLHVALASSIKEYLEQIGIKVELNLVSWSSMVVEHIYAGEFQAVLMGLTLNPDPDVFNNFHSSAITQGINFGAYSNPEMDRILRQARVAVSPEVRRDLYGEMQKLQAQDLPYVFLISRELTAVAKENVRGIVPSPLGLRWPERWYIEE